MDKLRDLRKQQRLTQEQLARLAGTTQPQIRKLEAGERRMTKEWAERLAPYLGVSPQSLLFGEGVREVTDLQYLFLRLTEGMSTREMRALVNLLYERASDAERAQLEPLVSRALEGGQSDPPD